MADTDMAFNVLALKNEMCRKVRWPSDITNWTTETRLSSGEKATIVRIVMAGLRRVYHCGHPWSFLRPRASFTAWATCGAKMTVGGPDNKTVTADAAIFVPEMVGAALTADTTDTTYTIISYVSSTVVTVSSDASADNDADFEVTARGIVRMPDNFASLLGKVHFDAGSGRTFGLDLVSIAMVEQQRATLRSTGCPRLGAIVPAPYNEAIGQRFDLHVWPTPDANYTLRGRYLIRIVTLPADTAYLPGGEEHAETIRTACLAAAEHEMEEGTGIHTDLFVAHLAASIDADRRAHAPETLGVEEGDPGGGTWQRVSRTTYAGVQYK